MYKTKIRLILTLFVFLPFISNASLLSFNDYSRDSSSTIVTGGGLEWLQWTETANMTLIAAMSLHGADGWRLATNKEMQSLLTAFFPDTLWGADENTAQSELRPWNAGDDPSPHVDFVSLFGASYVHPSTSILEPILSSQAIFGSDADGDGLYNRVEIRDDWTDPRAGGSYRDSEVQLYKDYSTNDTIGAELGYALVREVAVNEPHGVLLLMLGFLGLWSRSKKAQ